MRSSESRLACSSSTTSTVPCMGGLYSGARMATALIGHGGFFGATVVRLPLLFGPGLNKNVLFDLLIDHDVENIHPDGVFQYYAVAHLWRDANIALERGLAALNVAGSPVPTRELALRCFGRELTTYPSAPPPHYDVRSKHAPLWGGAQYLYSKERVLHEITEFIEK